MRYLPVYYEWLEINKTDGCENYYPFLCNRFGNDELLKLFTPNTEELEECESLAWGHYGVDEFGRGYFNPFRQNVVLFMAAMAGEL